MNRHGMKHTGSHVLQLIAIPHDFGPPPKLTLEENMSKIIVFQGIINRHRIIIIIGLNHPIHIRRKLLLIMLNYSWQSNDFSSCPNRPRFLLDFIMGSGIELMLK